MVLVGMGDQDMRDRLAPHRIEQGLDMAREVGAGVDDGDVAGADDIAAGTRESDRAGIAGDDAADERAHADAFPRPGRRADVEGEVVWHPGILELRMGLSGVS